MRDKPFMTYLFLGLTVVMFILPLISPSFQWLYALGVKDDYGIASGQYWRLITPLFFHFGWEHLIFNMITFYFLGMQTEYILGHFKFSLLYLLSGIMGNLFSYQFSIAISAGASTGIFGLFTFYLVMSYLYPRSRYYQVIGTQYFLLLILNLASNLFTPNVDLAGHIGGIVGGVFVGLMMMEESKEKWYNRILGIVLYVTVAGFIMMNNGIYHTIL